MTDLVTVKQLRELADVYIEATQTGGDADAAYKELLAAYGRASGQVGLAFRISDLGRITLGDFTQGKHPKTDGKESR